MMPGGIGRRNDLRTLLAIFAMAVLLTGGFIGISPMAAQSDAPGTPDSVDPTKLQWWGSTNIGQGSHIRVPVTVENTANHSVTNGAVLVELDIAQRLIEAGWVGERTSTRDLLRLFDFDSNSVRVVAMNNLEPYNGGFDGGLRFHDGTATGLQRHVVPSTHFTGSTTSGDFHERTNPMITVLWHVHERLEPGEKAHFMIYFDTLTNRAGHPALEQGSLRGAGTLERSFWSGPGVDLVGLTTGTDDTVVRIIGLHDGTEVEVREANVGGRFPSSGIVDTFTIDQYQFRDQSPGKQSGGNKQFRLIASQPILALVNSEGYVPTPNGRILAAPGEEFLFTSSYDFRSNQDSLFFHNLDPRARPVEIVLERLDENGEPQGQPRTIRLSHSENQFPYTLGANAGSPATPDGDRCAFPLGEGVVQIEPGRFHYRAQVDPDSEGGPVALQLQPTHGVTQIPAIDGSPMGTDFWSAFSRSSASGDCGLINKRPYQVYAASTQESDLFLFSPEANPPHEPFFSCTRESCPGDPLGPIPGTGFRGDGEITTLGDHFDRLLNFRTTDPAWLMVSPERFPGLSDVQLRGPLGGGDAGRHFVGIGDTKIYPPFPDTRVNARIHYNFGDPFEGTLNLVGEQFRDLPKPTGASIQWYELKSNRPIVVLPTGHSPTFLGGLPQTLDATIHRADYRGHLVEIATTGGDKSVVGSTGPGESLEYTLLVTNLGRNAHGEPLTDRFTLETSHVPEGWTATVDPPLTRTLATGESQRVTVSVTPPEDAASRSIGTVRVHAVSQEAERLGNDRIRDTARATTMIETDIDLDLFILDDSRNRLKFFNGRIAMNEMFNHTLLLQNKGTNPDTIELNLLDVVEPGWTVLLLHEGRETHSVTLDPGQSTEFTLQVIPPRDQEGVWLPMSVEARSGLDPTVSDVVSSVTDVVAPFDLFLESPEPIQWVPPGREALFPVVLGNTGQGTANVFLQTQVDELRDWKAPSVFTEEIGVEGEPIRVPIAEQNVFGGSQRTLWVNVTAPEDAVAGDRIVVLLQAQAGEQAHALNEFLFAIVQPVHRIHVEAPALPLHAPRGGVPLEIDLWLTNEGNLDETLRPMIQDLPPGWRLTFDEETIILPRNATSTEAEAEEVDGLSTARLGVLIEPPLGVADGAYTPSFDLVSREGNRTTVDIPVRVGAFLDHDVQGPELIQSQPGRIAWAEFRVGNLGNVPMELELERLPMDEEPWDLARLGPIGMLPPGGDDTVMVGWQVPREAEDGTGEHRASLVLRPQHPDVDAVRYVLETRIEIARADLFVQEAASHPGAGGHIVRAVIGNQGQRPAYDVGIELRVGTTVVDETRIGVITPGTTRNVTLLQPDGHQGQVSIVVNGDASVVESDRTNNMLTVTDDDLQESPGPRALVVLIVVTVLGWVVRRRTRTTLLREA